MRVPALKTVKLSPGTELGKVALQAVTRVPCVFNLHSRASLRVLELRLNLQDRKRNGRRAARTARAGRVARSRRRCLAWYSGTIPIVADVFVIPPKLARVGEKGRRDDEECGN
jgi:hypothetical protein